MCILKSTHGTVVSPSKFGGLGSILSRVMLKTLKMVYTASLFGAHHEREVWRKSCQACLLCPWERHLMGLLHLQLVDT